MNIIYKKRADFEPVIEAVQNVLENEYLTNDEKTIIKQLVTSYKISLATKPAYTTDEIEGLNATLSKLYDKTVQGEASGDLAEEIFYVEEQLYEATEKLMFALQEDETDMFAMDELNVFDELKVD